ncbi:hypothetical protein [Streptomyces sp. NPDC048644]|uniref:hypothetical protein n=1 Tax=Streptomyces sp. NPDC048644 TaxID=3365582 RepID=UPI0037150CCF
MAEEIRTTEDLHRLFAEYPKLATQISTLGLDVEDIKRLNLQGAGDNDEVAEQYKSIANPGTEALERIVKMMSDVTDSTGQAGGDVMKIFRAADEDNQRIAESWNHMQEAEKKAQEKSQH